MICQDRGGVGAALGARLRAAGAQVLAADATGDTRRPEEFAALWQQLGAMEAPKDLRVLFLSGLDAADSETLADLEASVLAGCGELLHLFQSLSGGVRAKRTRVTVVTRGAQAVVSSDAVAVSQAPLLGLLSTLALEFPEIGCAAVDLPPRLNAEDSQGLDALMREVAEAAGVDRVALRNGARYVARLVRLQVPLAAEISIRADASYLVTGGLGALGLLVARHLVERGARHLTLVGRREPSDAARAVIRDLEATGATITHSRADVARGADVAQLVSEIQRDRPPLAGIVHAAGVRDDGVAGQQTLERFAPVLAPKVAGAWNLHTCTRDLPLDFFALFSSSASVFGSPGQANYSAANAFLAALAHERRRLGLPATSIAWGPWAEGGMAADVSNADRNRWAQIGLDLIKPVKGLIWLGRLAATPVAEAVVLPANWARFSAQAGEDLGAFLEELTPADARASAAPPKPIESDFRAELERLPKGRRRAALDAHVRDHVRAVLALAASMRLGAQEGFRDLGMDSLMAVDLRNRLQRSLGCTLPATVAFDHPNVDALAAYIGGEVLGVLSGASANAPGQASPIAATTEPIAIVGIGCRFPGGASDPEAFWRLLHDGVDAITEIPAERWDVDAFYDADPDTPGKMYTRWGGFLDGIDRFDPRFFGMTPREAVSLDPQQRLLLEVSWEALENAGQRPDSLRGSSTGVFIGISGNEYVGVQLEGRSLSELDAYAGTGNAPSMAAGRLSFTLGLQGPSFAVDTACSSSLVAVHLACQSLRLGESRLALAAGVNLILTPTANVVLSRARMMSADGRCKTFDASADGYVRGEGCGVVVLKRLNDAIADGDNILALIRGTAVNQDGRSSGLTVPNGLAQESLIREALEQSGVAGEEIGYVEAHGTGTSLGDPIEVRALGTVLCADRPAGEPLRLGSVKTNLGHLEAAAGIAGLIKTVLALRHEAIPPHLHFVTPNPLIPWAELPVEVPTAPVAWPRAGGRRVAGVSSFGFSGTNAHVVVEEAPVAAAPAQAAGVERPCHVLVLSGRTDAGLRAAAEQFVAYLSTESDAALPDVCFTANTGRAHFEHRLAAIGGTREALRAQIANYLTGVGPAAASGRAEVAEPPKVAFMFAAEAMAPGIERELIETQPAFRRAVEQCAALSPLDAADLRLFAVEYALAELLRSWGIEPSVVMAEGAGASVAGCVAGCVAGVFTLEEAIRLVGAGSGGDPEAIRSAAATVLYQPPQIELVSSVTGEGLDAVVTTSAYWADRRERASESSHRARTEIVFAIGPRLTQWHELLASVAALEVRGATIDWAGFDQEYTRRKVALPTYPFQRERYWVDAPEGSDVAAAASAAAQGGSYRRDWLYDIEWPRAEATDVTPGSPAGSWLILAGDGDVGSQLGLEVERRGGTSSIVRRTDRDAWKLIDARVSTSTLDRVVWLSGAVHPADGDGPMSFDGRNGTAAR